MKFRYIIIILEMKNFTSFEFIATPTYVRNDLSDNDYRFLLLSKYSLTVVMGISISQGDSNIEQFLKKKIRSSFKIK